MPEIVDDRIAEVLRRVAELPDSFEIKGSQELKADLAIDSLKMIDVIIQVEGELGIEMGDDFSRELLTVTDLQHHAERLAAG
ncbi:MULTISPECIES: acyl carrier protein [unclassified Streptomyces]|uniref:acyl carrier protein n=1 Tax=unclassified Streptomyces TaxID=2593676 RepID=UPI002254DC93|nr:MULTISPECIES: acyl carrier protein [unclassified Streptomyces]MCX5141181.1 acyl carrier protein [Streptomyces sp. NBC_00338]WRZ65700.1 acyl carrier protein [Streptomyces sp. NBC_01257]WSU59695.1 acyl carrier protein [Streptomyces sp. NBC_01104]